MKMFIYFFFNVMTIQINHIFSYQSTNNDIEANAKHFHKCSHLCLPFHVIFCIPDIQEMRTVECTEFTSLCFNCLNWSKMDPHGH